MCIRDSDVEGHQLYDGPSALIDVTFHNFSGEDIAIMQSNAVEPMLSHAYDGIAFVNTSAENAMELGRIGQVGNAYKITGAVDVDGSITGFAGAQIFPSRNADAFYHTANTYEVSEWGAFVSPDARLGNFVMHDDGPRASEFQVTRENGATLGWTSAQDDQGRAHHAFFMNDETYKLEFDNSNDSFEMHVMEMPYGDSVIYEINGLHIATRFTEIEQFSRDNDLSIREVSSLNMLQASHDTAVYRDLQNELIYIKFVAEAKIGWHNANAGVTFDDALMTGAMIHVDQTRQSRVDVSNLVIDAPGSSIEQHFSGTSGDDIFYAFSGDDTLDGGAGADSLFGGLGNDRISGDRGNDQLVGNSGGDALYGRSGDDLLVGNSGADKLRGGSGNDRLIGGAGSDLLSGGDGGDTFVLDIDRSFDAGVSFDDVRDFGRGDDVLEISSAFTNVDVTSANVEDLVRVETTGNHSFLSVRQSVEDDFEQIARLHGVRVTLEELLTENDLIF